MTFTSVAKYIADHWYGNHSLNRSAWINGLLFYLAMVAISVVVVSVIPSTQTMTLTMAALFASGMTWSLVGIVRAATKTLQDKNAPIVTRFGGAALLLVSCYVIYAVANDVRRLFF